MCPIHRTFTFDKQYPLYPHLNETMGAIYFEQVYSDFLRLFLLARRDPFARAAAAESIRLLPPSVVRPIEQRIFNLSFLPLP